MKKWIYISLHIVVWILLLASDSRDLYQIHNEYFDKSIASSGIGRLWYALIFNFAYYTGFLVAFYGAYFFVAPSLFIRKRYIRASIYLILVFTAMVAFRYVSEFYLLLPYLKFDNYLGNPFQLGYYVENCILYTYKYSLFGLVVYFVEHSYRIEKEKKEIEKEKIQAELSFLRSQINPHFLFNTINDIYSLTYRKDDKAPQALLKLSSILRYMLDEGIKQKVLLERELLYIQDYIELQDIGSKKKAIIDFSIEGVANGHEIAPLILIPFVENIYKHGVINSESKKPFIHICIENDHLTLVTENQIRNHQKDKTGGIGIANVKRRLELIYPKKHSFKIEKNGNIFFCSLKINLS